MRVLVNCPMGEGAILKQITMKTPIMEVIEWINEVWSNGGWELTMIETANKLLILEKEQTLNLIRFMRTNDKMGKSVEDLYNEFYNQNK